MDSVPFSMQEVNDFPEEDSPPIRICEEESCEEPAKKRGRGYSRWCTIHLEDHKGDTSPRPSNPKTVTVSNDRVAKKAEEQAKAFLSVFQGAFLAKGDQYCAWALGETAEPIAKNLGMVASDFKFVAKMVDKSDKYFALTMLTYNVTRLGLMIGCHHDVIPYHSSMRFLGVPEPPTQEPKLRVVDGQSSTDRTHTHT